MSGEQWYGVVMSDDLKHLPLDYRAPEESRYSPPADVCDTCSNFEAGLLVPVSFCEIAKKRAVELEEWHRTPGGSAPFWLAVARDRYGDLFI